MATLTSKNQDKTLELPKSNAFILADGDMLIIGIPTVINRTMDWLIENGVSNIYFDPTEKPLAYSDFLFVSTGEDDEPNAIRLYN